MVYLMTSVPQQHGLNFSFHSLLPVSNCWEYQLQCQPATYKSWCKWQMCIMIGVNFTVHLQTKTTKCVCVLPPCLLVINPRDILQVWMIKRENWLTKIKSQQRNEKWWHWKWNSNWNRIIEEIADCGNVDMVDIQETLDMQPEEFNKHELAKHTWGKRL